MADATAKPVATKSVNDWHVIGRDDKAQTIIVECQATRAIGTVSLKDLKNLHDWESIWAMSAIAPVNPFRWNELWGKVTVSK